MEDIVVIGGGLAGAALSWALSEKGRKPLLIEQHTVGGAGATAHSRGMIRAYDPDPHLAAFGVDGVRLWADINATAPNLFVQPGLLYFLTDENVDKASQLIDSLDLRQTPIERVNGVQVKELYPDINPRLTAPTQHALWEPNGGYIDPRRAARVLADEAVRLGATVLEGCEITGYQKTANAFTLDTGNGKITARQIILAVGAQTQKFSVESNVFCRSIPLTSFADDTADAPGLCLIDEISQSYLRPSGERLYYAGGAKQNDAGSLSNICFDTPAANAQNLSLTRGLLSTNTNRVLTGHPGFDAYTPDFRPLLHHPDNNEGLGVFTGFSGRGAKYLPFLARQYVDRLA